MEESFESEPSCEVIALPEELSSEDFYALCSELSSRFYPDGFEFQAGKSNGCFVLQAYGDYAIMFDLLSFIDGWLSCWAHFSDLNLGPHKEYVG